MAEKLPQNVPGKWYITDDCTGCGACLEIAPENIAEDEDEMISYIKKQPENAEEEENLEEAADQCPTEAILKD